ncbi:hypothetical protein BC629DRAFT_1435334 [Irpex lacteus]|nr:hypothetical protein BC629DRAFT_1435334 [Irpex lacteus]
MTEYAGQPLSSHLSVNMKFTVSYLLTVVAIATSANAICCIYGSPGACRRGLEKSNLAMLREEDILARGELEFEKRACCCAAGNAQQCQTHCQGFKTHPYYNVRMYLASYMSQAASSSIAAFNA